LVQKIVQDYYKSDDVDAIQNIYKNHRQSGRLDVGLSVDLSFEIQSMPEGESFKNATVELSKHSNFKDSEVYNLNQKLGIKIYHLETDTKYYYKLTLTFTNGSTTSNTGSFKTAEGPRLLNIDGIANVRDIGGYSVISGAKIKQGLLFRGSELDGAVNPKYSITGIGISDFLTKLDIKTCMDLRYKADLTGITNPLGDKVNTKSYDAYMYTEIFSASGKNVIKKIFTDLANKNNYPIYMHCTHGLDRTGTVVYLLDALLGMSETDMMKEYKLSVLYHGWSNDEEMNAFIVRLKRYEGATLQEKAANFLISAGVTQKQIDNIRDIFLTF